MGRSSSRSTPMPAAASQCRAGAGAEGLLRGGVRRAARRASCRHRRAGLCRHVPRGVARGKGRKPPSGASAIVDVQPNAQFLYPEFLLFQKLFERHGMAATICDPAALRFEDGALRHEGERIDLVYNRLTDFGLDAPESAALREAYLAGAVVLTPHPRAHAVYADKRNLSLLTDAAALAELGVDAATREVLLAGIPRTERVRREDGDALWARRRQLFFKPAAGYGSKGRLSRRQDDEACLRGSAVGRLCRPGAGAAFGTRGGLGGTEHRPEADLRNYVYRGRVQLVIARLYQGQTTNFRTAGGGFAPVLTVPMMEER
ncbi:MAG: hypothetical protein M5R42_12380 [Rhodocyclaceae bacterium]|nr:hypothetical protein [Rhodocyclaceae bacterium]